MEGRAKELLAELSIGGKDVEVNSRKKKKAHLILKTKRAVRLSLRKMMRKRTEHMKHVLNVLKLKA